MNRSFLIIFLLSIALYSCKKDETAPSVSGTVTINSTISGNGQTGYYTFGFSFSKAKKVSTQESPGPDVTLYVIPDTPTNRLTLQVSSLNPSFAKTGDYPDEQSAAIAFDDLKTIGSYQWEDWANPISENQVWVYRTGTECYAKMRIIHTLNDSIDNRPYGECTFEWVYQPDGSTSFPVK
jgi:hypothetical protein